MEGAHVEDPADLGNTCVALVVLLRSGDSPKEGAAARRRAPGVRVHLPAGRAGRTSDSLYVTSVRDTQMQVKDRHLCRYLSCGLGAFRSERPGRGGGSEKRRIAALEKVTGKIERNQRDDGSFDGNNGWAAVLSQGLCSKALNMASRSGAKVSKKALEKDQKQNASGLISQKATSARPRRRRSRASAGVSLYREASKLGLREKRNQTRRAKQQAEQRWRMPRAPAPAQEAGSRELERGRKDEDASTAAQNAAVSAKLSVIRNTRPGLETMAARSSQLLEFGRKPPRRWRQGMGSVEDEDAETTEPKCRWSWAGALTLPDGLFAL